MIIEKDDKIYIVKECNNKWTVITEKDKISIVFEVSKELCSTFDELKDYVVKNSELF